MMASDPFEAPSPVVLLLIILIGLIATAILAGYGFSSLGRLGIRRSGRKVVARSFACLAAAAMAAMYVWGAFHLFMDETMTDQACKRAVGLERAAHVDRYAPSYVPLGLSCHVENGDTYITGVPGYVNPAVLGLGLVAVVLAGVAGAASESSTRDNFRRNLS